MSSWKAGDASLTVRAGVHEDGFPVVVLESRGADGRVLRVMLSRADLAVVQAGLEAAWRESLEMANGTHAESPS